MNQGSFIRHVIACPHLLWGPVLDLKGGGNLLLTIIRLLRCSFDFAQDVARNDMQKFMIYSWTAVQLSLIDSG